MKLKYQLIADDTNELVANIYYDESANTYSAELKHIVWDLPPLFGFPEVGSCPNPCSWAIENFLKSRVIPPNRDGLKYILQQNGIYEYDWKVLIKLNKGRSVDDGLRVEVVE